jgi:hypothetical protein
VGAAGWDPVWITSLGYARDLPPVLGRAPLTVDAALTLPVFVQPDVRAWKLSAGASILLRVPFARLGVAGSARGTMALSRDPTGSKLGLGYEFVAQAGHYGTRWTAAFASPGGPWLPPGCGTARWFAICSASATTIRLWNGFVRDP